MSFSDPLAPCSTNALMDTALQELKAANIVPVVSTGNNGGNFNGWPSCFPQVVSVAASTKGDLLWPSSNISSQTTVVAPGDGVLSSGALIFYQFGSGTSQAAPHVAAAVAIKRQEKPALTFDEMVAAIKTSTVQISWAGGSTPRLQLTPPVGPIELNLLLTILPSILDDGP